MAVHDTQVLYNKLMQLIRNSGYDVADCLAALTLCEHEVMEDFKTFVADNWGGDPHYVEERDDDEEAGGGAGSPAGD